MVDVGDLVTKHAAELELREKLAQQLGRALSKSLNRVGWGAYQFIVLTNRDEQRAWYSVQISERDPWTKHPVRTYAVYDEALGEHTASVADFHEWIRAAGRRLVVPFSPTIVRQGDDAEAAAAKDRVREQEAEEELAGLGFHRLDGAVLPPELEAAIASIKRSLDACQDS